MMREWPIERGREPPLPRESTQKPARPSPLWEVPRVVGAGALWLVRGESDVAVAPCSARAVLVRQVFLSGVRALPLIFVVAFGAGAAIVLQTTMAPEPPSAEFGRMLVVVVLRELAPLLTAIVVAGHSGIALVAERQNVWPRVAGCAVAVTCLAVHFAAVAMLGGFLVSESLTVRTLAAVRAGFEHELAFFDLPLFLVKTSALGAIVGAVGCRMAFAAQSSAQEVARAASRTFVTALLACTMVSAAITIALYALVGAPPPP